MKDIIRIATTDSNNSTSHEMRRAFKHLAKEQPGIQYEVSCTQCGHCAPKLKRCSKCQDDWYCNEICQNANWQVFFLFHVFVLFIHRL